MRIRMATSRDRDEIRDVHRSAFPENENKLVCRLAVDLLAQETAPRVISLVAECDGIIVGHVAFSPVTIDSDKDFRGYILAPLGVRPAYQGRRVGSQLVDAGMQQLSQSGIDILFVYGDPAYYGRFGFRAEPAGQFKPPYELQYPSGWQALALGESPVVNLPANLACVASLCDAALW